MKEKRINDKSDLLQKATLHSQTGINKFIVEVKSYHRNNITTFVCYTVSITPFHCYFIPVEV